MGVSKVITRTSGELSRVMKQLRMVDRAVVTVGIQGDNAREAPAEGVEREPNNAEVATWNEFGTSDGHVPARSFMRSTFDERRAELVEVQRKALDAVAAGKMTTEQALHVIGEWFQGAVQKKIVDLRDPPNAPATIEAKGSSNPLIDTGQLRQSITHEVRLNHGSQRGIQVVKGDTP